MAVDPEIQKQVEELKKLGTTNAEIARSLSARGLTGKGIAEILEVNPSTISRYLDKVEPLPPLPVHPEERMAVLGQYIEGEMLEIVVACLQQMRLDVKRKKFTAKYNPNVIAGTLLDKLIKLRMADRMVMGGTNRTQVNIFTDIDQIDRTIDKVMENALDPETDDCLTIEGDVHTDDTPEPLHPGGPQASPEAGGVPPSDGPEDE